MKSKIKFKYLIIVPALLLLCCMFYSYWSKSRIAEWAEMYSIELQYEDYSWVSVFPGFIRGGIREVIGQKVITISCSHSEFADLSYASDFSNLQNIYAAWTSVEDLEPLKDLKNLEILILLDTKVSDISHLSEITSLKNLQLDRTDVTDISPLAGLKNLERLHLRETRVTDIMPLKNLKKLIQLNLSATEISKEQIEELQNFLPRCSIIEPQYFTEKDPP